jgi:hypothetical protein
MIMDARFGDGAGGASYPPIAIRMAGLPGSASPALIETWIKRLKHVAELAASQFSVPG